MHRPHAPMPGRFTVAAQALPRRSAAQHPLLQPAAGANPQCECLRGQHQRPPPTASTVWPEIVKHVLWCSRVEGTHAVDFAKSGSPPALEHRRRCWTAAASQPPPQLLLMARLSWHVGPHATRQLFVLLVLQEDPDLPPLVTAPLWAPFQHSLFVNSLVQLSHTQVVPHVDRWHHLPRRHMAPPAAALVQVTAPGAQAAGQSPTQASIRKSCKVS